MFNFNGVNYNLPGVYGAFKVINQGGANLPDFNVGLIVGKSMKGHPYHSSEIGSEVLRLYSDPNALARDYGYDNIYKAFKKAQAQGAGACFVLNAQRNSQFSAVLPDGETVPADSLTVKAAPKNYGVFGNDITLSIVESASEELINSTNTPSFTGAVSGTTTSATNTTLVLTAAGWTIDNLIGAWVVITGGTGYGQTRKITDNAAAEITVAAWTTNPDATSTFKIVTAKRTMTITPTKNQKMITADVATGDNYCYVNDVTGLGTGMVVKIMNNDGAVVLSPTILSVDSVYNSTNGGYKIVFTAPLVSAIITKAKYARIMQQDTDNQLVYNFSKAEYTTEYLVTYLNAIQTELEFTKEGNYPPAAMAETYLMAITSATLGTNPLTGAGGTDYALIADKFPEWSKEFLNTWKMNIRLINLVDPTNTNHAYFKSLATTIGNTKYKRPVIVITGGNEDTAVEYVTRAKALNTDQVVLCGNGFDGEPDYLSLAPQVFGLMMANPTTHNLTRDLLNGAKPRVNWTDEEEELLTINGVLTFAATKTGYRIIQGINTYQDHTFNWNVEDKKSYLIQQKQLGDYFHIGIMQGVDDLIGTDGVDEQTISKYINASAQKYIQEGYIDKVIVKSIKKVTNGYEIEFWIYLPDVTDFIGVTTYVVIGETES